MSRPERIVIVGGGIAGLASAARLAQAGLPVTLLEATHLGFEASTRNQGWLHSGAWFAPEDTRLARLCYNSLRQTEAFAPEIFEPARGTMLMVFPRVDAPPYRWLTAWQEAGIPYESIPQEQALEELPGFARDRLQHVYRLPDRSFDPQKLLERLAAQARNAGAELRPETPVVNLIRDDHQVLGVVTSRGEEIFASRVVLATGALSANGGLHQSSGPLSQAQADSQVLIKTHLVSACPGIDASPLCVVDDMGFNHLPHSGMSVFGSSRWHVIQQANDSRVQPLEIAVLWRSVEKYFPDFQRDRCQEIREWAGTTVQVMQVDQIHPARAPFPAVIDHEVLSPADKNLWTISPGRASLWIQAAEDLRRQLLEGLDRTPAAVTSAPWTASDPADISRQGPP